MNRISIILLFIVVSFSALAQEKVNIHKTDKSILEFLVPEIDNISIINNESELYILKTDASSINILISEIDSITFYVPEMKSDTVYINYDGNSVTIDNGAEYNGVWVENSEGHVVVKSTLEDVEMKYVLSGATNNGSFKIYSDYRFELILNNVDITNTKGAAINVQSGKRVSVTLPEGTQNYLTDSETYKETSGEDMKATFFSEGQLVFAGTGSLNVKGNNRHAICNDDYIRINEGNITVTGAVKDGIHVNDYFRMDGGTVNITAGSDGIECEKGYIRIKEGNINISCVDDGIKTSYSSSNSDNYLLVEGGKINVTSTTAQKGTGLKSKGNINITGGNLTLTTHGEAAKAINCSGDMVIDNGNFSLTTTGNAFYDTSDADISSSAGIKCDGTLQINDGNITIHSSGSGGKGINVTGELIIAKGTIDVTTTGNQFTYGRDDTAAKAIRSKSNLTIHNGDITVKTSKTEAEGIESKATLTINGGTILVEAYDDCLNASNHIEITGGYIYCNSAANDGIDSNGTLTISGGIILSAGTTGAEAGIDCDNSRFEISGGIIIGIGGSTSTPTTSACTQRSVVYSASNSSGIYHIESSDGATVLTFKSPRTYSGNNNLTLLFSSPDLLANTSYTIYTGGSISGDNDFYGLHTNAAYTKGTAATTFTTSSMVTTIGSSGGGGNPGGGGGGWRP